MSDFFTKINFKVSVFLALQMSEISLSGHGRRIKMV